VIFGVVVARTPSGHGRQQLGREFWPYFGEIHLLFFFDFCLNLPWILMKVNRMGLSLGLDL
jgi:hypothetical protein